MFFSFLRRASALTPAVEPLSPNGRVSGGPRRSSVDASRLTRGCGTRQRDAPGELTGG
ncbi:hypothetical protein HMPREF0043_01750 [Actinobaculum sp. oral taxon 183 str. F0552]|nr:hypothetical protein HMPREF0043_01750 [Actinobaculum sp. oral taxon 183 str. F0552]